MPWRYKNRPSSLWWMLPAVIAILAIVAWLTFEAVEEFDAKRPASAGMIFDPPPAVARADVQQRLAAEPRVYPFSVVPGGVRSREELERAVRRDHTIQAQYYGFNINKLHFVRLTNEERVHVSYRIGDRIYWTKKKVRLHPGETLLTDGAHYARARCGNLLLELPKAKPLPKVLPQVALDPPPIYPYLEPHHFKPIPVFIPPPSHGVFVPIPPPIFIPPDGHPHTSAPEMDRGSAFTAALAGIAGWLTLRYRQSLQDN